jgi:hypothetical protein
VSTTEREAIQMCEWFLLCDRDAAGTVTHPILGEVPVCERCASALGLDLNRYSTTEGKR